MVSNVPEWDNPDIKVGDIVAVDPSRVPKEFPVRYSVDWTSESSAKLSSSALYNNKKYNVSGHTSYFTKVEDPTFTKPLVYENTSIKIRQKDLVKIKDEPPENLYMVRGRCPYEGTVDVICTGDIDLDYLSPYITVRSNDLIYVRQSRYAKQSKG